MIDSIRSFRPAAREGQERLHAVGVVREPATTSPVASSTVWAEHRARDVGRHVVAIAVLPRLGRLGRHVHVVEPERSPART